MHMTNQEVLEYTLKQSALFRKKDDTDPALYDKYNVKRGLRDKSGSGVVAGLTHISEINAFRMENGEKLPCPGELFYRGIDVKTLINGFLADNRFGFEETAYLLLFGNLPSQTELQAFEGILNECRALPLNFTRDVIMKAPPEDIMSSLTKSVLSLAYYDKNLNDLSLPNVLKQCLKLISVFPMLAVYGYNAYNHYSQGESLIIHNPDKKLSTAENILRMLRPNKKYTPLEAQVLDAALILHMEHGGGNNSAFTARVVTSSGSDTYSVMAAALCSLKGPKHGGANIRVAQMMRDIKKHVKNTDDEQEFEAYLAKILDKQAFDKTGLIYGMGHAVYSLSDPRAEVFQGFVEKLA
ncbi:MAG: citrate synthase, partial [Clostridia bacterium]|nr:citrate synthase [Clostridia bacterium]